MWRLFAPRSVRPPDLRPADRPHPAHPTMLCKKNPARRFSPPWAGFLHIGTSEPRRQESAAPGTANVPIGIRNHVRVYQGVPDEAIRNLLGREPAYRRPHGPSAPNRLRDPYSLLVHRSRIQTNLLFPPAFATFRAEAPVVLYGQEQVLSPNRKESAGGPNLATSLLAPQDPRLPRCRGPRQAACRRRATATRSSAREEPDVPGTGSSNASIRRAPQVQGVRRRSGSGPSSLIRP